MSFLDNLENSLKHLEAREEKSPEDRKRREAESARAVAAAPWAAKLKESPWTQDLLGQATLAGRRLRTKIFLAWLDTTLRLELRGHKLDLCPTAKGIEAVFLDNGVEVQRRLVDLEVPATVLLDEWLSTIPTF